MKYPLLFLLILLPLVLFAQINNFQAGYYLLENKQRVDGFINMTGDLQISKGFEFRSSLDGPSQQFSPLEVSALCFTADGVCYQSLKYTYRTTEGDEISTQRFALKMIDGEMKLYQLERFKGEYFKKLSDIPSYQFILEDTDGTRYNLEVVEVQIDGNEYKRIDKYKGPLNLVMQDWPARQSRIERLRFRGKELQNLIVDYLAFKGFTTDDIVQVAGSREVNSHGVYGALNVFASEEINADLGFKLGYAYSFLNLGRNAALKTSIGLEYMSLPYDLRSPSGTFRYSKYMAIRLPIGFRYVSSQAAFNPYFGGRLMLVSSNITANRRFTLGEQEENITGITLEFNLELGVDFKKFNLFVNYERIPLDPTSQRYGVFWAGLGYQIK